MATGRGNAQRLLGARSVLSTRPKSRDARKYQNPTLRARRNPCLRVSARDPAGAPPRAGSSSSDNSSSSSNNTRPTPATAAEAATTRIHKQQEQPQQAGGRREGGGKRGTRVGRQRPDILLRSLRLLVSRREMSTQHKRSQTSRIRMETTKVSKNKSRGPR